MRHTARGKEQLVLVRAKDGGLVLHTLYYADEVRTLGEIVPTEAQLPFDPEDNGFFPREVCDIGFQQGGTLHRLGLGDQDVGTEDANGNTNAQGEGEHDPDGAEPHAEVLQNTRVHSQGVRKGSHPRGDPGEIGWLAVEQAGHGLYEYRVG